MESGLPEYDRVATAIRERIVKGGYSPGQRLPNYVTLGREFGVGQSTIREAVARLGSDRFVRTRRRSGTFVADAPPHLTTLALVLPKLLTPLYESIRATARTICEASRAAQSDASGWEFREYTLPSSYRDPNDWPKLVDDVARHRVGGLIFTQPIQFAPSPIDTERGMPRVMIAASSSHGVPCVYPEANSFVRLAVRHLLERGRRRIAHLRLDECHVDVDDGDRIIASLPAPVRPVWLQMIPFGPILRGAAGVVRLLMQLHGEDRPDALVVHDDNLIAPVIAGLMSCGVRVPDNVEVVALANFPCPRTHELPITRIGLDCFDLMQRCIDVIDMQRRGEKPPECTFLPAVFADQTKRSVSTSTFSAEVQDGERSS
jgi:DNA-binding LacI/PurR family transcriptional regulator